MRQALSHPAVPNTMPLVGTSLPSTSLPGTSLSDAATFSGTSLDAGTLDGRLGERCWPSAAEVSESMAK